MAPGEQLCFHSDTGGYSGCIPRMMNGEKKKQVCKMLKIRGGLSRFHGVIDLSDLNLPENATKFQIREASRKRTIEPLGLPYDATDQQIINALKDREDEITAAKTRQ